MGIHGFKLIGQEDQKFLTPVDGSTHVGVTKGEEFKLQ